MDKLDLQTPNLTDENIQKLIELFPNCVTEDVKVKLKEGLKQELSNHIVEGKSSLMSFLGQAKHKLDNS